MRRPTIWRIANGTDFGQSNAVFVAGMAALRSTALGRRREVFETWSAFGPRIGLSPLHAVGTIMLARALAGAGRTAEARKAYEEAFRIWKDADPTCRCWSRRGRSTSGWLVAVRALVLVLSVLHAERLLAASCPRAGSNRHTKMEFVLLPAGDFVAGSPTTEAGPSGRRDALPGARRDSRSTWRRTKSRAASGPR